MSEKIPSDELEVYFKVIRKANDEGRLDIDAISHVVEGEPEGGYKTFKPIGKTITFNIGMVNP